MLALMQPAVGDERIAGLSSAASRAREEYRSLGEKILRGATATAHVRGRGLGARRRLDPPPADDVALRGSARRRSRPSYLAPDSP
jgi:hypothetical protein